MTKDTIVPIDPLFKLSVLADTSAKDNQANALFVLLATIVKQGLHRQHNVYKVRTVPLDKANVLNALQDMHVRFNQFGQQFVYRVLIARLVRVRVPLVHKARIVYQVQLSQLLVSMGLTQRVEHLFVLLVQLVLHAERIAQIRLYVMKDSSVGMEIVNAPFAQKGFTALRALKNQFNVKLAHTALSNQVNVKFVKLVISVLSVLPFL